MTDGLRAFGRRLKELADEKGISVDELSKATKIRAVFIEAMFRGTREDLPDDIFVVGFIKALLDHLRVNPVPWVEEYRALTKPESFPEEDPRESSFTPVPEIRTRSHFAIWAVLVLAILACSGIYLFRVSPADLRDKLLGRKNGPSDLQNQGASGKTVPGTESHGALAPFALPQDAKEKELESEAATATDRAQNDGDAGQNSRGLLIKTAAPCWIELKGDGGRTLLKREVAGGESLVFPGRGFVISVGDSSAVEMIFDGKSVEIEKSPGKVIRDIEIGGGTD